MSVKHCRRGGILLGLGSAAALGCSYDPGYPAVPAPGVGYDAPAIQQGMPPGTQGAPMTQSPPQGMQGMAPQSGPPGAMAPSTAPEGSVPAGSVPPGSTGTQGAPPAF
jgi:hypothetical protein